MKIYLFSILPNGQSVAFVANVELQDFYRLKQQQYYAIPVGLLDDDENFVIKQQIFIDEKPHFYTFANETKNMTGEEVLAHFSASANS